MFETVKMASMELRFLHPPEQTNNSLTLFEMRLLPGGRMPVPHHHRDWEETVYGLTGNDDLDRGRSDHRGRSWREPVHCARHRPRLFEHHVRSRHLPVHSHARSTHAGLFPRNRGAGRERQTRSRKNEGDDAALWSLFYASAVVCLIIGIPISTKRREHKLRKCCSSLGKKMKTDMKNRLALIVLFPRVSRRATDHCGGTSPITASETGRG